MKRNKKPTQKIEWAVSCNILQSELFQFKIGNAGLRLKHICF
jgi:hypothetical protein